MNPIQYKGHTLHFFKRGNKGNTILIVNAKDSCLVETIFGKGTNQKDAEKLGKQAFEFVDKIATREDTINHVANLVATNFRTFGGNRLCAGNPISVALAKKPPVFAAGVDVKDVVEFVLRYSEQLP